MAIVPDYNPQLAKAGVIAPLSPASTAANLKNYGVTVITTTKHFTIDRPRVGGEATLYYGGSSAGSTKAAQVSTHSTATVFYGTTSNTLEFDAANESVQLIGYTTASWLITSNSGGVTLSASTGA